MPLEVPMLMPTTEGDLKVAHRSSSINVSRISLYTTDQARPGSVMLGTVIYAQAWNPFEPVTRSTRDSTKMGDGIQLLSKASLFLRTRKKSSSLSALMTAKRRPIFHVLVFAPCRIIMANKHANRTTDRPCLDETLIRYQKGAHCESLGQESELATSMVCPKVIAIRVDLFSWQEHTRAIFIGSMEMLTKAAIQSF